MAVHTYDYLSNHTYRVFSCEVSKKIRKAHNLLEIVDGS